jgi:hypothetical protein
MESGMNTIDFYKDFMNKRNKGSYEIDGAINIEKWKSNKYKILFVLKETAGYQNCPPFYLEDELKNTWLQYKQKRGNQYIQAPTYKNISLLAKSLQMAFNRDKVLDAREILEISTKPDILFDAIENCAIINIKKHSNAKRKSDDKDILSEFIENKELLKWQIENLSPTIIFAGSSVCWKCLSGKKNGLYKDIITTPVKKHECKTFNGIIFYHANHPSAYGKYKMNIPNIHKQIFIEAINNGPNLWRKI